MSIETDYVTRYPNPKRVANFTVLGMAAASLAIAGGIFACTRHAPIALALVEQQQETAGMAEDFDDDDAAQMQEDINDLPSMSDVNRWSREGCDTDSDCEAWGRWADIVCQSPQACASALEFGQLPPGMSL